MGWAAGVNRKKGGWETKRCSRKAGLASSVKIAARDAGSDSLGRRHRAKIAPRQLAPAVDNLGGGDPMTANFHRLSITIDLK